MTRKLMTALVALVVAGTLVGPAGADEGDAEVEIDPRFPTEWVVVGEDGTGDWGGGGVPGDVGAALGMDLVEARIRMPDADTVEFVIEVTDLPPIGGTPEVPRYTWELNIDGEPAQLDGKFTNYSRGICDPTSGQCDPSDGRMPRDPGLQPFFFRGNCGVIDFIVLPFNACQELAVVQAIFDADENTITIPVPVEVINLLDDVEYSDCSVVAPGEPNAEGHVVARASAFLSFTGGAVGGATSDGLWADHSFNAPHALDAEEDCFGNPLDVIEDEE
jgi:hypothetical protein